MTYTHSSLLHLCFHNLHPDTIDYLSLFPYQSYRHQPHLFAKPVTVHASPNGPAKGNVDNTGNTNNIEIAAVPHVITVASPELIAFVLSFIFSEIALILSNIINEFFCF